jgi:hypothetical protein
LFTCIDLSGYDRDTSYPLNTYPHFLLYFYVHCFDHDVIEAVRVYNVCHKLTHCSIAYTKYTNTNSSDSYENDNRY